MTAILPPGLIASVVACLVALVLGRGLVTAGLADVPDAERKLHRRPNPTAGGLAILGGIGAGALVLDSSGGLEPAGLAPVLILALAGGALGLADDLLVLGARFKLAVMTLSGLGFVHFGHHADMLSFAGPGGQGGWVRDLPLPVALGGSLLWLLVCANAVNFMDGANGLSMGSLALGFVGLAACAAVGGATDIVGPALVGAAACAGFLVWNVRGGQVFSGDVGALGAGLFYAGLGLWAARLGVPVWPVALCVLPLLLDAILTVMWRARRRQNLLTPHASHAYQIGIRAGVSHGRMALLYWGLTLHCGLSAVAGSLMGGAGAFLALAANTLVGIALWRRARAYGDSREL